MSRSSGCAAQDVADVGDEAEIEHAVGFVEHQHLDAAQVEHVLLEEVDQAPRRADQDVDPRLERAALLLVVDPAECETEREPGVLAEDLGVAVNLHGELARRRHDQRARRTRASRRRDVATQQRGVQRDEERGRLAGARLRLAGDVEAGEGFRQRLGLDRCAAFESCVRDAAGKGLGQVQVGKGDFR